MQAMQFGDGGHESENFGGGHRMRMLPPAQLKEAQLDIKLKFYVLFSSEMSRRCPIGHESEKSDWKGDDPPSREASARVRPHTSSVAPTVNS